MVLLRPQIMGAIREHIIRPALRTYDQNVLGRIYCPVNRKKAKPKSQSVVQASLAWRADDDGDGCSDDEGCETEDDSYYGDDTETTDGCSDDGGCDEEDTYDSDDGTFYEDDGCSDDEEGCEGETEYTYTEDPYYADDGCSCDGSNINGSGGGSPDNFFNTHLGMQYILNETADVVLSVEDMNGTRLIRLRSDARVGPGTYRYPSLWDGHYGSGRMINPGTYAAVLEWTWPRPLVRREYFTYSAAHGFQVGGGRRSMVIF